MKNDGSGMCRIRPYRVADKSLLIGLLKLNIPAFFSVAEEEDFTTYLDDRRELYFVFEKDAQIIGSGGINIFEEDRLARLSWDVVHPDHQRQGIGRKLVEHRLNIVQEVDNIDKVVVRTSQHAYAFYATFGFILDYINEHYWGQDYHLYHMTLPLTKQIV